MELVLLQSSPKMFFPFYEERKVNTIFESLMGLNGDAATQITLTLNNTRFEIRHNTQLVIAGRIHREQNRIVFSDRHEQYEIESMIISGDSLVVECAGNEDLTEVRMTFKQHRP